MRVEQVYENKLTVERSRFVAVLFPATTVVDVKAMVARQRKALPKANHHCWALRTVSPQGRIVEQARDDGEVGRPGMVLLSLLQRHDLEGALLVSRVFGGIKLGAGGVARAFRQAAAGAIASEPTPRR